MSYASDLKEHYCAVRARLGMGVSAPVVPKALIHVAAKQGVSGSTGIAPPRELTKPETPEELAFPSRRPTWRQIIERVAREHGITPEEIYSKARRRVAVNARMECMYRLRTELQMSFINIGNKVNRDHSTVIHGYETVKARLLDADRFADHHAMVVSNYPLAAGRTTHEAQLVAG